jgi:hypoxanthine phosphoribosyltransferase
VVLAAEIARTIPDDFVMVGLLKGTAVFVADVVRALDAAGARPEIEFMRASSYGPTTESQRRSRRNRPPFGLAAAPACR